MFEINTKEGKFNESSKSTDDNDCRSAVENELAEVEAKLLIEIRLIGVSSTKKNDIYVQELELLIGHFQKNFSHY